MRTLAVMKLGAFSISLAVKDLSRSMQFYSLLGFEKIGGDGEHWVIMQNATTTIGLFQGMFDKNLLTFNPGWNHRQETLDDFTDVRELKKKLEAAGVELTGGNTDESESGPAHITLIDPDGNPILFDQHV